jgi:hypothetical protein
MDAMKLFIVYLGGKVAEERMGEDHEVVAVVACGVSDARKKAKAKWRGIGDAHVDAVQELDVVDGYAVRLESAEPGRTPSPIDPTWAP